MRVAEECYNRRIPMQGYYLTMATLSKKLRYAWRALWDRRTPGMAKLAVIIGILYGISPLDVVPDVIPLLGQLDDLGVLLIVLLVFLRMTTSVRGQLERTDVIDIDLKR